MAKTEDTDDKVLSTAKTRFKYALERSSHNREKMKDDIRFAAASPDDPWQWEKNDQTARKGRPMLTINKMPQHIRQVTNDIRMNRPSIRFRPADDKADVEVADILMDFVRHIEANSDADVAYDTAADHQVTAGLGYLRVLTDYVREDSFDQDIFIGRVKNPFMCYDDPDIQDPSGSDRKFFFVEEKLKEDEFKAQYPDADPVDWNFAVNGDGWFSEGEKEVRVVEYFEVVEKQAELLLWANGATSYKGDKLPQGVYSGEQPVKTRKATKCLVMWHKLNGQQVLASQEFPSRYIPFARVVGNEYEVDGKTYISGLVRNAKDSQRMYNVAQSAIVERVMQAPKSPWAAPAEAVEGYEKIWQTANTANHSYLPYNHVDNEGNPIPAPQRTSPATVETGLNQIAMGAADDIKSETGQYDASLGQRSNETSGRAIMARQREGDMATFHYVDNLSRAVRHVGRIILDMIPKVYDTERVAMIIGEDDEQQSVTLDPNSPEALSEVQEDGGAIKRIFNPNIGTYDVFTTTGPSFTSRRMEAVEAMTQMTQANPQLWQVIGDLLVKNMDWPGADDMAKRLKLTLLPQVQQEVDKDEGQPEVPPQIQQAMQQMQEQGQQMQQALQNAMQTVQKLEGEAQDKDGMLFAEQIKRQQAEIRANEARSLLTIERAQQEAMQAQQEMMQPAPVQAAPSAPPVVFVDSTGQVANAVGQMIDPLMMAAQGSNEAIANIAAGQERLFEALANEQAVTQAMLAQMAQPKVSSLRIVKQSDGSFVGEKVEG